MVATPRPIRIYHPTTGGGSLFARLDLKWLIGALLLLIVALVVDVWYGQDEPVKEITELQKEVRDLKTSMGALEEEIKMLSRDVRRVLEKDSRGEGGGTYRAAPPPSPPRKR